MRLSSVFFMEQGKKMEACLMHAIYKKIQKLIKYKFLYFTYFYKQ